MKALYYSKLVILFFLLFLPASDLSSRINNSGLKKTQIADIENGTELQFSNMVRQTDTHMKNYLKITINSTRDIIIKLIKIDDINKNDTCIRAVYIKGNHTAKIENIPHGSYYLKIAYGNNPILIRKDSSIFYGFEKNKLFKITEDIMTFNKYRIESIDGYTISFNCYEVKLDVGPTPPDNSLETKEILEDEFLE